jgi:hypothetical protein
MEVFLNVYFPSTRRNTYPFDCPQALQQRPCQIRQPFDSAQGKQ